MRRDALPTMLYRAALASSLQFAFGDRMHRVQSLLVATADWVTNVPARSQPQGRNGM